MGCIACSALVLEGDGVTLERKESSTIPVEADSICPDRFAGLGQTQIEDLPVFYGRRPVRLGDLFTVEGVGADNITVRGDLKAVKKIGYGMTFGRITVAGDAGPHVGAFMKGGEIVVEGSTGDWAGAHMAGGRLVIEGNAGHFTGAAYSGESKGMLGGTIVVRGSCGREVGGRMRRGLVVVLGDSGEFAGAGMLAGSVFVGGRLGGRPGAGMKRGTIVAFGDATPMLPTFHYACTYRPVFLQMHLRALRDSGTLEATELTADTFRRFVGDMNTGGRGEVLIRA